MPTLDGVAGDGDGRPRPIARNRATFGHPTTGGQPHRSDRCSSRAGARYMCNRPPFCGFVLVRPHRRRQPGDEVLLLPRR